MQFTDGGRSPDGRLVECIELPEHPFFVASQYHPEFKSRVLEPSPPFKAFLQASLGQQVQEKALVPGPVTTWD